MTDLDFDSKGRAVCTCPQRPKGAKHASTCPARRKDPRVGTAAFSYATRVAADPGFRTTSSRTKINIGHDALRALLARAKREGRLEEAYGLLVAMYPS